MRFAVVSDPIFGTRFLRPSPEFQSALRFAVVSDYRRDVPTKEMIAVSIRFEVRGGFRHGRRPCRGRNCCRTFQSALRFAVVSDSMAWATEPDMQPLFQSALRFAVVSDDCLDMLNELLVVRFNPL